MKTTTSPVIVSRSFPLSPVNVWEAITRHDQMIQWFFENIPDFKAEKGFSTSFVVRSEERVFTHQWEVIGVIPEKSISYTWRYEEYQGSAILTMELHTTPEGTLLKVINQVTEDFPEDIPEFTRESCEKGWDYFINQRLKHYLEKS